RVVGDPEDRRSRVEREVDDHACADDDVGAGQDLLAASGNEHRDLHANGLRRALRVVDVERYRGTVDVRRGDLDGALDRENGSGGKGEGAEEERDLLAHEGPPGSEVRSRRTHTRVERFGGGGRARGHTWRRTAPFLQRRTARAGNQ